MASKLIVVVTGALLAGALVGAGVAADLSPHAELELGVQAARRGYWQEALYRFERARALDPSDAKALNNVAVALEAVGRYEDAKAAYEQAATAAPDDSNLRRNRKAFDEFYRSVVAPPAAGEGKSEEGKGDANATP